MMVEESHCGHLSYKEKAFLQIESLESHLKHSGCIKNTAMSASSVH